MKRRASHGQFCRNVQGQGTDAADAAANRNSEQANTIFFMVMPPSG